MELHDPLDEIDFVHDILDQDQDEVNIYEENVVEQINKEIQDEVVQVDDDEQIIFGIIYKLLFVIYKVISIHNNDNYVDTISFTGIYLDFKVNENYKKVEVDYSDIDVHDINNLNIKIIDMILNVNNVIYILN